LLTPELFAEFSKGFHEEINLAAREREASHIQAKQQLAEVERKIGGVMRAIEDGMYTPAMKTRMAELEAKRTHLEACLADMPAPEPVRLHPKLPEIYRRLVEELHHALNDPLIRDEAAETLRGLITKIVLTPRTSREGVDAILHGDVAAILELCDQAKRKSSPKKQHPGQEEPGRQLSVVAGAHNHLYRTVVQWP
jgi:site-specific DNA recombinase